MAKKTNSKPTSLEKLKKTLCDNLSFAGAEAYKQLRTCIAYSLPGDEESRVIAVTSPTMGDGKSTTSINLANSLAATGKKVLLIEGDMRLPQFAPRLEVKMTPGLSDLLVGKAEVTDVVQTVPVQNKFFCVTAGNIPPNPSELLSSNKMEHYFKVFKNTFDYIIMDLPPVNVVADASSLAKQMDGYVLVVRQGKTTLSSISEAMEKMKIVDGKVLGFVLNDVHFSSRRYGKNYEYEYK